MSKLEPRMSRAIRWYASMSGLGRLGDCEVVGNQLVCGDAPYYLEQPPQYGPSVQDAFRRSTVPPTPTTRRPSSPPSPSSSSGGNYVSVGENTSFWSQAVFGVPGWLLAAGLGIAAILALRGRSS